jgi:hypothetical protein
MNSGLTIAEHGKVGRLVAAVLRSAGLVNPLDPSDGFATWRRVGREQLVDSLVRNAQDGDGIAHRDPPACQSSGSLPCLFDGEPVGGACRQTQDRDVGRALDAQERLTASSDQKREES